MPGVNPNPARPRKPAIPTAELLTLLADADCCFTEVAQRCSITVEELSLYLMSDEGRELFMAAQSAAMMRVRLAATSNLNHAVSALSLMLMTYQSESETLFRDSPPTRKFREIQRVNARRAASLLTRLANLQYRPLLAVQSPHLESSSLREGFGVGGASTDASNRSTANTSPRLESSSPSEGFELAAHAAPSQPSGTGIPSCVYPLSQSSHALENTGHHLESLSPKEGFGVGGASAKASNRSTAPSAAAQCTKATHPLAIRTPAIPALSTAPTCRSP